MTFGRISASQKSRSVRRIAARSAETAVLIGEILPPPGYRVEGAGGGATVEAGTMSMPV